MRGGCAGAGKKAETRGLVFDFGDGPALCQGAVPSIFFFLEESDSSFKNIFSFLRYSNQFKQQQIKSELVRSHLTSKPNTI